MYCNKIQKVHKYKITKCKDGRYSTFVPDSSKPHNRRAVRKTYIKDLEKYLIEFYYRDKQSNKSFAELYKEWVEYKRQFCGARNVHRSLSPSTIRRYERDFDNYLADSRLSKKAIKDILPMYLEVELVKIIEKNMMVESAASNMISYVRQTLDYGKRAGYIKENPCDSIDRCLLLSKCVTKAPKNDSERVLTTREMESLREAVSAHEKEYSFYMPDYAIELAMMTGMRAGEIAALRWRAVDDQYIHVDESEHRYDYSDKPSELVIGEPKNLKHRLIPLTEEMKELFARIRALNVACEGDFIFVREKGGRCTGHDLSCALDRRASEAGVKKTSIHGIRRTVSSILRTKLPVRTVANMLGHVEQTNEEHYNYDFYDNDSKIEALSRVFALSTNVHTKF